VTINQTQPIRRRGAALLATASGLALLIAAGTAQAGVTIDGGAVETVPGTHASPWVVNGSLVIGDSGVGELDVSGGGQVTQTPCSLLILGFNSGGDGTLKVDGAGSTVDDGACAIDIGFSGQGNVLITNGGHLNTGTGALQGPAGKTSSVTVTGAGSQWNLANGLTVGTAGTASLTVGAGGTVTQTGAGTDTVGSAFTGVGTVAVGGASAHLALGGSTLVLGGDGAGNLNVTSGGLVDGLNQVVLGKNFNTSVGHVTVSGAGASLVVANNLELGEAGIGTMAISAGGHVTSGAADIGELSGSNGTVTVDGAGSLWAVSGSLFDGRSGAGSLSITNGAHVTSVNGGVSASSNGGSLTIDGAGSSWVMTQDMSGSGGPAIINITAGGILSDRNAVVATSSNSVLTAVIDGAGSAWNSSTNLDLGNGFNANVHVTVQNGGLLSDATANLEAGQVRVTGLNSSWLSSGAVRVGGSGTAILQIDNSGVVRVGNGSGVLTLGQSSSSNGKLVIGGLAGSAALAAGTLQAGSVVAGTGNGSQGAVIFNHTSNGYNFALPISGPGQVQVLGGVTNLGGASTYTGATTVDTGATLNLSGSLGATAVGVQNGGILTGTGSIGGPVTIGAGGILQGQTGNLLTMASLVMQPTGIINVTLGAPDPVRLFQVNGALTLDGTINIAGAAFGPGVYRIIDYTGALTNNGLVIGALPGGADPLAVSVQTGTAGQVNIAYSSAGLTQYWNGSVVSPNGSVNGGTATWNTTTTNWSNGAGNASAAWGGGFAIFTAAPGTVTVSNAGGQVTADGMQFAVGGYTVSGQGLSLTSATPTIRVGDGTAGGAAFNATISAALGGSNGLIKTDLGTLLLSGANTFSGGLTINAGKVTVANNSALGNASNLVTLAGGTLAFGPGNATYTHNLNVTAASGLTVDPGAIDSLSSDINGSGALTLNGTLIFTGAGNYSGSLSVASGAFEITGHLGGNVVLTGGTELDGDGIIDGSVTVGGGRIYNSAGQTMDTGAMTLSANSAITAFLGAPGNNALFSVHGALVLDGNLTVANKGGFGPGLYRLFDYSGALTDNGLNVASAPGGVTLSDLSVQTSIAGQVNLIYSAGPITFWNGSHTTANGTVNGGAGTWKLGPTNWTDTAGANAGAWTNGQIAIFAGTGGPVTIDNSGGAISASGLQFAEDGYGLTGGALTLTGPATVRVGDGTAAGAFYVAAIGAPIGGSAGLTKTDLGALQLSGANTYAGGTTIQGGILGVDADNNLGGAAGGVTLAGGQLKATSSFATNRLITVSALSSLNVVSGKILTLNGDLAGSGNLIASGPGSIVFTGAGSFTGAVGLTAGTLEVDGTLSGGGVAVSPGAQLTGGGTIQGAVTMSDGSRLYNSAGLTLNMGPLMMTQSTAVSAYLGAPGNAALFSVHGGLTLDGQLTVIDQGGFGLGVYRLFDYTGALTNNGLTLASAPAGVPIGNLSVQTSVANQVNLVYSAAAPIQFWNGSHTSPNWTVNGGDGTWAVGPANWTDANGSSSSAWNGNAAVFMGAAGIVTIDNSGGQVSASGIQFASNGYSVGGGGLLLTGAPTTLRVGDGTAAGASFNAAVVSSLSGSGGVIKTDLGNLSLLGANSFTGGLTILGGTVSVGADNNLGAAAGGVILNGGALSATGSFATARAITVTGGAINTSGGVLLDLTGALGGAGSLTKGGSGTLRISGNSSGYSGVLGVSGGVLQVDGTLGGQIVVNSGARLKGIGQVGTTTVASGGTLAPGNSIGTLTVAGNLTLASGSTYEVELNSAGQADLTHATGTITLQGGAETLQPAAGTSYVLGTRYTVLTADGGLSGTFGSLNGSALAQPFLKLGAAYDATHAYVDVVRNGAAFCSVAATYNQCASAGGAESLGQGNAVYNAVANLPDAASARAAFDGLSGEAYASLRGVMTDDSRFVRDAASGRLAEAGADGHAGWGQVFGADGHLSGDGNAARVTRSVGGLLMGGDWQAGETTRLGVLAGYSRANVKVSARTSSGNIDSYHLGVYGKTGKDALSLTYGAAYAWQDISLNRASAFGGTPSASARAGTGQVFAEAGYRFGSDERNVTPFLGLAAVSTHARAFTESGGATALKGLGGTTQTTFTTVGLRGAAETGSVSLKGVIAWRGASGDVTADSRMAFASGGSAFTVKGAPMGDSALVLGADLGFKVGGTGRASLTYDGVFGGGLQDQSLKAGLKMTF
jgi:fibronectin-binding autotransporter adhesin